MNKVRIYVEGGGDGKDTKAIIRRGFREFLGQWKLKVIACGPRNAAFDNFLTALQTRPEAFNILLVDAEGPVREGDGPWAHLFSLENSWRDRNPEVDDEHCHLMVQMMEAWLVADVDALSRFYGQYFNANAIPRTLNVEEIDKARIESALEAATRNTTKGEYHKIHHGAKLLRLINPQEVRSRAAHCDRLFTTLASVLEA